MATKATGTMKAVCMHEFGGADKLKLEDLPMPSISDKEVLVRVHAASVNPVDYKRGGGNFRKIYQDKLPWIPGGDFSGVVEEVGSSVKNFKKGDSVYGSSPNGGAYAEFVAVSQSTLAIKPKTLDHVDAASVPLVAQTAWQALFKHGSLQKGQSILIHGGSGGVGTFAVQLAHWKGATVLATGSESNHLYLKSLGANDVIDYNKTRFESLAKNIDFVLDLVGGETLQRSYQVLKKGGTLVSLVEVPSEEEAKKHQVKALWMHMTPDTKDLAEIASLIDQKKLKTVVYKIYPLAKANEAWKEIMQGHTRGKIILSIIEE